MESYGDLLFELFDKVETAIENFKVCAFAFFLLACARVCVRVWKGNVSEPVRLVLQVHLPVISILCNPGIRDRHWDKMSLIYQRNLKPDTGTTLRKVLQLGLEPYMEQFEQVSAGASKVRRDGGEAER